MAHRKISHKADGRKVVALAVTGMVGMVGMGAVWLPFMSDRDKIRGMAEDENMTEEERFKMMREMQLQMSKERAGQGQGQQESHPQPQPQLQLPPANLKERLTRSGLNGERSHKSSGSMWKNMTQARGG